MQKESLSLLSFDDHLGCFGEFNPKDPVCKKFCAVNLRCAIDYENNARLDILDDFVYTETLYTKIQ